jgi:polyhydroxybutyrate depolymerase
VAAAAVVSGALYSEPGECRPSRPIPLLDIHGTADEVVPYGGRAPTVEWPLPMTPVPDWLVAWAGRDGCPDAPLVFLGRPEVTGIHWTGCRAGGSFAEVVWDFFATRPLPG